MANIDYLHGQYPPTFSSHNSPVLTRFSPPLFGRSGRVATDTLPTRAVPGSIPTACLHAAVLFCPAQLAAHTQQHFKMHGFWVATGDKREMREVARDADNRKKEAANNENMHFGTSASTVRRDVLKSLGAPQPK